MSLKLSDEAKSVFKDASICFSEEEWKLLQEWQKELYKNVMNEIHQALISLGPIIATTVHSLRAKDQEEQTLVETHDSDRKYRIHCSPGPLTAKTVHSLRAQEQEEPYHVESQESERKCRIKCSLDRSAGFPFLNTATHLTKDDPASIFIDHLGTAVSEGNIEHSPGYDVVSFRIKDEAEIYGLDPQDNTHIQSCSRPRDNRSMNSSAVNNKTTSYNAPQVETHLVQNSEKESTSKSRTWLQCNPDPCKSVFSYPTQTKLQQATSLTDRAPTYLGCESAVKNVKHFAGQVQRKQHWNQFTYTESELSGYQKDIPAVPQRPDNDTQPHTFTEHEENVFAKKDLFIPLKTNLGETHHQCVECGKTFNKNTCLIRHKRIHTGERPFQCAECGKSFNRKEVLSRHKMIHTGEKPYQCAKCGKTFIQKTDLVRHQKVH